MPNPRFDDFSAGQTNVQTYDGIGRNSCKQESSPDISHSIGEDGQLRTTHWFERIDLSFRLCADLALS